MTRTPDVSADASVAGTLPRDASPNQESNPARTAATRATTLPDLERQFSDVSSRFQALIASSSVDLCCAIPPAGSWSAAQCLQHLNICADAYFPVWQQVIANAGPRKTELNAPYRIDFWGRLLSWILEPPARIRSRTPVAFEPLDCTDVAPILDGFLDRQQRIIAALYRCRGRAIDQVNIASPADPRIRYSIWSSFIITAAHQRRHLWQAEQAIAKLRETQ